MFISIIGASSIAQTIFRMKRLCQANLDSTWIFFLISIILFFILLIWTIVAIVMNNREEGAIETSVNLKPVLPIDPFVKSDTGTLTDDIYNQSPDRGGSNYLISSSSSQEEVNLMDAESKLYELSLVNEKDPTTSGGYGDLDSQPSYDTGGSSFNFGEYSSNTGSQPSSLNAQRNFEAYLDSSPSSFDDKSSFYMSQNDNVKKSISLNIDSPSGGGFSMEENLFSESRSIQLPEVSAGREKKHQSPILDFPGTSRPSSQSREPFSPKPFEPVPGGTGGSLKIQLPKKDVGTSKDRGEDLHRTRTAPLKAMRIDLPDKGKKSGGSNQSRIDLPNKGLQ